MSEIFAAESQLEIATVQFSAHAASQKSLYCYLRSNCQFDVIILTRMF